jgi:hypothetical protein
MCEKPMVEDVIISKMKTSVTAWALNLMRLSATQVALVIFALGFKR